VAVFLGALSLDINLMAEYIDDVEGIKFAITFYVSRTYQVCLMNVVNVQGFPEIRVFNAFGSV
jgi:hypothetical protein